MTSDLMPPASRHGPQHPDAFFVYGTLRPGQWNFRLIAPLVVETMPATLHDHVLYGRRLLFPYAVPGRGRVVGDVLMVDPINMTEALRILDALEGYAGEGRPNHYERRSIRVITARDTRLAWVYLAGIGASRLSPSQVIPTGDWLEAAGRRPAPCMTPLARRQMLDIRVRFERRLP